MKTPNSSCDDLSRRDFLSRAGVLAAAAGLAPSTLRATLRLNTHVTTSASREMVLRWRQRRSLKYTPDQMALTLDEIGRTSNSPRKQGILRRAPDELPVMVASLAKKKRRILWVALDTVRPDEPHWEKAIRVAKQLGVPQYRHRGFQYTGGKPLKAQIANFHSMAKDFAAVNKAVGIQAVYQIHAGQRMAGSAAWDLDMILGDIDPRHFGVAFDTQHVMVEQGQSWPNAVQLLAPRTVACASRASNGRAIKSSRCPSARSGEKPHRSGDRRAWRSAARQHPREHFRTPRANSPRALRATRRDRRPFAPMPACCGTGWAWPG